MKILCIGPGAMGCLFAAALKRSGHEVILMDYKVERADQLCKNGIHIEGVTGSYNVSVPVVITPPPGTIDLVLVCVKAGKTQEVARLLADRIGEETLVATLQNGIGNLEILARAFGSERVLGGVTSEGATLVAPGKVRHAGQGQTFIGALQGEPDLLKDIISVFNKAGFRTQKSDTVTGLVWGKLLINVGINALTAITRLRNGILAHLEDTRHIMELAVSEAAQVAKAKGIRLPYLDPIARVIEVCHATAANIASMLQDILNKRTTEVDFINGAIVKEGRALGIPTPVNDTLTRLVKTIEQTYDQQVE